MSWLSCLCPVMRSYNGYGVLPKIRKAANLFFNITYAFCEKHALARLSEMEQIQGDTFLMAMANHNLYNYKLSHLFSVLTLYF